MRTLSRGFLVASLSIFMAAPAFAAAPEQSAEKPAASRDHKQAEDIMYKVSDAVVAGKNAEAIALLKKCIQVDNAYPQCTRVLGILYGKQGDERRAAAAYRRYLRQAPNARDATAVRDLVREYEAR